ncbi:MAG: nucleoside-diphosphate kinase [Spirochaetaceae bacterium]|jgi:nucleoside-diphosphate kinase|nr:nucleoside-diphosphate kinase [Spirochaetaceae bacterium]
MDRTFVMLKPGTLHRRIVGEIFSRFERKGLKIIALKMVRLDNQTASTHYEEHRNKDFYGELVNHITSGPIIAFILEGADAVSSVRRLIGSTKVQEAQAGTIRGDFAYTTQLNIIHASDSPASAQREIDIFFRPDEIYDWEDNNRVWF